jgi:hypothetical protein
MTRIVAVEVLPGRKLRLRFDDGMVGVVDLSNQAGQGLFAPWKEAGHFDTVKIAHGGRSIEWPGAIDLCADALYLEITGMKVEQLFPNWQPLATNA